MKNDDRPCQDRASTLAASPALADSQDTPWTLQDALGNSKGLNITASIRTRYGLAQSVRPSDDLVTIQTAIAAEYDCGPLRIGGELIDSRSYYGTRRRCNHQRGRCA